MTAKEKRNLLLMVAGGVLAAFMVDWLRYKNWIGFAPSGGSAGVGLGTVNTDLLGDRLDGLFTDDQIQLGDYSQVGGLPWDWIQGYPDLSGSSPVVIRP